MDEKRLIELETRLSFQEDHLQELNKLAVRQANELAILQKQMVHMAKKLSSYEKNHNEAEAGDEPPPHY